MSVKGVGVGLEGDVGGDGATSPRLYLSLPLRLPVFSLCQLGPVTIQIFFC
jgi:hypothetical protein